MNRFIHRFVSHPSKGVISREHLFAELQTKSLVWFGEFHSEDRIVALQKELLMHLCNSPGSTDACNDDSNAKLHVVMEHFSIEMQEMLHRFQSDPNFGFDDLKQTYKEIGTEGHGLDPYKDFLLYCKDNYSNKQNHGSTRIRLHGGFIPRPLASRWYKANTNEKREVLEECYKKGFLPPPEDPRHSTLLALDDGSDKLLLDGSQSHFRLVRSMMSGEDLYTFQETRESDADYLSDDISASPIGKLYQAQLLKDHAMGYHLSKLMTEPCNSDDQFLVIAGLGHLKHYTGVPERLEKYFRAMNGDSNIHSWLDANKAALIGCQMLYETYLEDRYDPLKAVEEQTDRDETQDNGDDSDSDAKRTKILNELYSKNTELFDDLVLTSGIIQGPMFSFSNGIGNFTKPSMDYCFVYDEDDDNILTPGPSSSSAKAETQEAYNNVGSTASSKGNIEKAKAIMRHLKYTQEDMDLIGEDCLYNFQGVANPHRVAKLQPGECVLDVGSGLGVDSLLACKRVTSSGRVVGVDLASRQVSHSNAVAAAKGLTHLNFIQGDAEKLSLAFHQNDIEEESFDVCISNGAFCLIPDKKRALGQVYHALKHGGRMAISTTTIQAPQVDEDGEMTEAKLEWPICMRMFANLDDIQPMCEEIGFCDIEIIDAESPMEMEFDAEVYENENPDRFKIHGKYADQYAYLEEMDMDRLCKIVTIYGRKPLKESDVDHALV